jgi:hypothetical protein
MRMDGNDLSIKKFYLCTRRKEHKPVKKKHFTLSNSESIEAQ